MNVAICDDDLKLCSEIEHSISEIFLEKNEKYEIEIFNSGEKLLKFIKEQSNFFQIYLLDIEMDGINGLQAAKMIRSLDSEAIIIFVTSHHELMPDAFDVLAFNYIVKPIEYSKFKEVLSRALMYLNKKKMVFHFSSNKKNYSVFLSKIKSIESSGRKMIIHTTEDQSFEYYGTTKDALEQTKDNSFIQIHQSIIVNFEFIQVVERNSVIMFGGKKYPISKKYHESFHAAYRQYVISF